MLDKDQSPFQPLPWDKGARPYHLIAGPCSAESQEQTMAIAKRLKQMGVQLYRASLWKPRTRPGGFEGVGAEGLEWLVNVQQELGIQVMTEVASAAHIESALSAGLTNLWVGARTTSSPFAMAEIAESLRGVEHVSVLVKNPINPDINLWEGALLRLYSAGVQHIGAIHRGFSTYGETFYRNSPLWQIPIELKLRHPNLTLIVDPSHIGGKRSLIESISRSALEMHFDGLMIETHCDPDNALSDAQQQITPDALEALLSLIGTPLPDELDSNELMVWRQQINQIDNQLLQLLVERNKVAQAIGEYKHIHQMCILQPERYRELMRCRELEAQALGLNPKYIHDLFSIIHEESVHLQQSIVPYE